MNFHTYFSCPSRFWLWGLCFGSLDCSKSNKIIRHAKLKEKQGIVIHGRYRQLSSEREAQMPSNTKEIKASISGCKRTPLVLNVTKFSFSFSYSHKVELEDTKIKFRSSGNDPPPLQFFKLVQNWPNIAITIQLLQNLICWSIDLFRQRSIPECDDDADNGSQADISVTTVTLFRWLYKCGVFLTAFRWWLVMSMTIIKSWWFLR